MTKLKTWHLLSGVAVLLVALLLYARYERGRAAEEIGTWRAVAKRLQQDSAAKANEVRRVDSVFVRDTVRLTKTRTQYETVRDSVLVRKTDTLLVERVVAAADTAIRACREAVDSCAAAKAARDSLIVTLGRQRAADATLFRAQLRRANPRVTPYLEALVDPNGFTSGVGRAGLEIRILGPVRLAGALEATRIPNHTDTRALVGLRVTF